MFRRILLGLDGSGEAEQALPVAAGIAKRAGAELHLVHVLTTDSVEGRLPHSQELAEEYLARTAAALRATWKMPVVIKVTTGEAPSRLVGIAREIKADLIILTSHGRGGLQRLWLGSVSDRVLRAEGPPVLLLPVLSSGAYTASPFHHILVALDGTSISELVLPAALRLADIEGSRVSFVRVVEPAYIPMIATPAGVVTTLTASDSKSAEDAALQYLSSVRSAYRSINQNIDCAIVSGLHSIADAILRHAAEQSADVIAITTHGLSGIRRLILGSVADKLIRSSEIPILVQKTEELI